MGIRQKIIDAWNARKFYKTDEGKKIAEIIREYMGGNTALAKTSEQFKKERLDETFSVLQKIDNSENPFMTLREALADQVVSCAYFSVLTMSKEDGFASEGHYISGELWQHIGELSKHNELVKRVVWDTGQEWADNDVIDLCNLRKDVHLFNIRVLNVYREKMKDTGQNKDWLNPFLKCMCIWQEDTYRKTISLPSLLPNALDALKYSTFMNMVTNGVHNPLYEFEQKYPNLSI